MTFGLVVLMCTIHGFANPEDNIEALRAIWGHDPAKPLSWLTHAFLHSDIPHLRDNIFYMFLPSGALVELYLGKTRLLVIILFTAVAAAGMAGIAVPQYWDTKGNPVGFSAVAHATFVLGVYMGGRITTIWAARTLMAIPSLKQTRDWKWAALGTIVGLTAAGLWLDWSIGIEWANQDAAPRVAHTFGMLTGAVVAILLATSDGTGKIRQPGNPLTWFAVALTLIAILHTL